MSRLKRMTLLTGGWGVMMNSLGLAWMITFHAQARWWPTVLTVWTLGAIVTGMIWSLLWLS